MFDILYSIGCWAACFNTQKEQVPGFRQYDSTNPPVLVPDEVPPAWSRFFHQRFRRSRPHLKEIEASFSVSHGGIDMDSMQLASAVVVKDLNVEMMKFEREVRPRSTQVGFYENNQSLCYLATRAHGNAIIRIPNLLVEEFYHTSVNEVCCSDLNGPMRLITYLLSVSVRASDLVDAVL